MKTNLLRTTLLAICALAGSGIAGAQTAPRRLAEPQVGSSLPAKVDETFELNISERHITEQKFAASTAVGIGRADSVNLQVGVALTAERIDVTLRGVRGTVRFRASLQSVLDRINSHAQVGPRR